MIEKTTSFKKITKNIELQGNNLIFDANFDSGNLADVSIFSNQEKIILLTCGRDRDTKPSTKNWFHFSIQNGQKSSTFILLFDKINILLPVAKVTDLYRPVYKMLGQQWNRYPEAVQFDVFEGNVRMKVNVRLEPFQKMYLALIYPWSYSQNELFINQIVSDASKDPSIYINKQVLIYSVEKRPLHLIALSSAQIRGAKQDQYLQHLFPERNNQNHLKYTDKCVILITARVHPGEVGSSHSLNGILKFLISKDDIAFKLRKEFYFLIIPILNPDGVENGNNRMDALGQNLNRFYHLPDLTQQPSCYAVKSIVEHWRKQIYAFFDLHGHANRKSCFLYGNSIPFTRLQAQSMLFAKALSLNCEEIDFSSCNFSKKQMSSRDKNEELSKQGCARVVVHRWTNSPYCYTLQTGLHKNIRIDQKGIERYGQQFYTIETYQNLGIKMMITFHQILQKNKKVQELRKQMLIYAGKFEKLNKKKNEKVSEQKKTLTLKQIKNEQQPESKQNTKKGSSARIITQKVISSNLKLEQTIIPSNQKVSQLQQIMHKNKTYLLSLDSNLDNDD